MTNYDSFSHCDLTDVFFHYSCGSERVKKHKNFLRFLPWDAMQWLPTVCCAGVLYTDCKDPNFSLTATGAPTRTNTMSFFCNGFLLNEKKSLIIHYKYKPLVTSKNISN